MIAANNTSEQNDHALVKSSSEKSQRALNARALSRITVSNALGSKKSDCQPQKSSVTPSMKGGGFIKKLEKRRTLNIQR